MLIDPQDYEDLYPRDFIVDLPRPKIYIGPEAIFGREPLEFDADGRRRRRHDLIRSVPVDELDGLRPKGAATRHDFEPEITPSLDAALRYFLLSTAARRVRGEGNRHARRSSTPRSTSMFTSGRREAIERSPATSCRTARPRR